MKEMDDKRDDTPQWEAMEVEEAGHVGEVLQGPKTSPINGRPNLVLDNFEE
jgi:hypothetical protein